MTSVNIDECQHAPCFFGTCHDEVNGFTCECITGYIDATVNGETLYCFGKVTCLSVCHVLGTRVCHVCGCDVAEDENNCLNVNCNHGTCVDGLDTFHCECDTGYYGDVCDRTFYAKT